MYLKALEIQGFKSFPDKTVLNFGEDITAIVGPNGSGKSNISDAIRWVMGEQSSRSLRGAKMEDVIFGGTEKRSQVGFAQVTLVIDNTGHVFPMDETEVSVTRRYYRSGESEYYINRQSVRLRDVYELFLDTGMGREGYSIIGQGKIDEILSVKSDERREIFEEAAGISKFRYRKEESERKLARTEENMIRIGDKIAELELQVEPLRDQAEKAKRYLILRDELRVLEISTWLDNLETLKAGARKLELDFRAAEEEREMARRELDALYASSEQYGEKMRAKDIEAEALRTELSQLEGKTHEREADIAVLRSDIAHHRENIARSERELLEQEGRAGGLLSQMDEQRARIAEIDGQLGALTGELTELLAEATRATLLAGGAQAEAEALRGQEALATASAADSRAALSASAAENHELSERRATVEAEQKSVREQLLQNEKAEKETRRALEDAREEVSATLNIIAGHRMKLESRSKREADAASAKMKLTMDMGALDSRIRLLSEMEKEYEGFSKAVRLVMQAKNSLHGIHGPVAGLMQTDEKYTVAMEIALGAGLQNIVVDREEDAKNAIGYLKQRDGGRATFLPLSAIRGEELREGKLASELGFIGVASDLVRFDPRYVEIFRSLLGRTVVVEDLDCGIAIARKYSNRFRIVTLDGQVMNRGGSMTGGSVSRSAGVLSRASELARLGEQGKELRERLAAAELEAESAQRESAAARYEMEVAEGQRRTAEDEALRLEGSANHYGILLSALRENCENLEGELTALTGRVADNESRAQTLAQTMAQESARAAQYRREAEEKLSGGSEHQERSGRLSETISGKKSLVAGLTAEKDATARALADLQRLAAELTGDKEEKARRTAQYREDIAVAEGKIAAHQADVDALAAQDGGLRTRLTALNEEKLQLEAERSGKNRLGQEMNENLLNLERTASKLEQKIATGAMEEKQILDRLWEHYELSHSEALACRVELESLPKAMRRIGELKREIGTLGTPNIGAIEEFDRVNTRYCYLCEQKADVERAREELEGVIGEITKQMTTIFSEQFRLLNESFQETFLELFGGGKATLELEDEDDILNCGIEIKVQPPGKALKTITLLSGGEKAFVAIALYFSILKVHPTPFCVMDEIEAALDEANVTRFAKYMRRIAGKTQFIVITHRRGTMEEADVLYGVTMQERGVSKMLTINLNDLAKELKIE